MRDQASEFHRFHDRFDLLFYVTIITVALLLLVDLKQDEGVKQVLSLAVTILAAATMFLAVAAAGIGRRGRRITLIGIGASVFAAVVSLFLPGDISGYGGLVWLLLVVAAPVVALRGLMRHETVTSKTLLGAVSVFLLIGVAAVYLFLFIDTARVNSQPFFGQEEPTTVFAYFSLVTITSLGYGDFAPAGTFGRAAAAWEAIVGQIYLVVVVARLVSLFSGRRSRSRSDGPSASD
jgi:hypothetical protein